MKKAMLSFCFMGFLSNISIAQKPKVINTTPSNIKNLKSEMNETKISNNASTNLIPVSKKIIYTLKPDEKLYSEESFISITSTGEQYEFTTVLNNQYFLHVKGRDIGPFSLPPMRISSMKYICTSYKESNTIRESYFIDLTTGKKIGPYENIEYWSYLINKSPNGYYYKKGEQYYVSIFGQAKDLGPYESVNLLILSKTRSEFIYKKNGEFFIYNNGKTAGPYKDLQLAFSDCPYPVYHYQDKSGNYFVSINSKSYGPYKVVPQFFYSKAKNDPKYFISEKNGNYTGFYVLKDGTKISGNDPNDQTSMVFSTGPGTWIKFEKPELIKAKSEGKNIYCAGSAPWMITTSNGFQFGPANIGDQYSSFSFTDNNVTFVAANPPISDCDLIKNKAIYNSGKSQNYIIDKNGTEGPIDDGYGPSKKSDFSKNKTAFVINEKLYLDKKYSGIKNVVDFKFTNPTNDDSWYCIAKNNTGDSMLLYVNGVKVHSIINKNSFYESVFIYDNAEYGFSYQVENEAFYKSSYSKEFGPFESIFLAKNPPIILGAKKTIGLIANYSNVVINGQNMGEGTALTCDQKAGTFNWISTDGKSISINILKP